MDDLIEYKNELFNSANIDASANETFPEESFFESISGLLSESGILDDVEYCPYRNTAKGMKIDGYSWNALEKTLCGIVVRFTNEEGVINTLVNSEISAIGKRVSKFIEKVDDDKFMASLEVTDPGRVAANNISIYLDDALKFRVVVFTDEVLSTRVKKLSIDPINGLETSIEVWDLERLMSLDRSESGYESFTVDSRLLGTGLKVLPANVSDQGVSTYLGIMPGTLLSAIYDEFGQRLLESNVRTFLDFRASTNKGMRKSLVTEPENFFAYNNGITVTSTCIKTEMINGQLVITELENMQIVNGGQTTASIYFSPREKGGIKGEGQIEYQYKDIDLSKVFIQMKLTVLESDSDKSEIVKANIATYANSQNAIQQSDLVSNHPFHINIETRSRKQLMPAGETGLPTKWFYERARGQYSTKLRALSNKQKNKFETEYPKKQVFTKTDMAKYENTWRMKPYFVKKGAQANLKLLGPIIIEEFDKNKDDFDAAFYKDLVAKMILFRAADKSILKSDWYKLEKGFKAEAVTYTLALLRYSLCKQKKDINLSKIYQAQKISNTLNNLIVSLGETVRNKITDSAFRGGVANPSEFCKSEKGWLKIQEIEVNLSALVKEDFISGNEISDMENERKKVNEASKSISGFDAIIAVSAKEWTLIAEYFGKDHPDTHINVGIPKSCIKLLTQGKMLSDKQMEMAMKIRNEAYENGFDFVA